MIDFNNKIDFCYFFILLAHKRSSNHDVHPDDHDDPDDHPDDPDDHHIHHKPPFLWRRDLHDHLVLGIMEDAPACCPLQGGDQLGCGISHRTGSCVLHKRCVPSRSAVGVRRRPQGKPLL